MTGSQRHPLPTDEARAHPSPPPRLVATEPGTPRRRSVAARIVATARPRQWVKNVLVFAAPGAAGVLTDGGALAKATGAFAVFCLAASGTYFLNDAFDVAADRHHPRKRMRPIAAGELSVALAKVVSAALLLASVAAAFVLAGWALVLVIGIYAALQPIYSVWLKHVAVVDLAVVASGFLLRAIAGGVAVGVPISQWFLIVAAFGSLFIVAGKRHAEHVDLGAARDEHRVTLGAYSASYLRYVRSLSSSVAIAAYCLWGFERAATAAVPVWFQLSIIPFVLAILRYGLLLDAGKGGAPEDLVLTDRSLQVLGLAWLVTFALGVYAG